MTNTVSALWAEEWHGARCLGDTETFFLPDGKISRAAKAKQIYKARQICNSDGGCPIKQKCLKYALDHNITSGVWGGTSEEDRQKLLQFRKDRLKPSGIRAS